MATTKKQVKKQAPTRNCRPDPKEVEKIIKAAIGPQGKPDYWLPMSENRISFEEKPGVSISSILSRLENIDECLIKLQDFTRTNPATLAGIVERIENLEERLNKSIGKCPRGYYPCPLQHGDGYAPWTIHHGNGTGHNHMQGHSGCCDRRVGY